MTTTLTLLKGGLIEPSVSVEGNQIDGFLLYSQVKKGTADNYRNTIKHFLDECPNPTKSASVHLYIEEMKKKYSPLTISRRVTVIKLFCKYLNDFDIAPNKVHLQTNYHYEYRGGTKERIEDDKFQEMLATCDISTVIGLRDYALLRTLQSTAMRLSEPLGCTVGDIKVVTHPSGEKVRLLEYVQKGDHKAFVRLFDKTWEAIDAYLTGRGDKRPESPLFASHGQPSQGEEFYLSKNASAMLRTKFNAVGLVGSKYTAHSFRYTQAIKALEATGDEHKASQQLRHLSPKTIQFYTQDYRGRLLGLNMLNLEV
jgi:integrase/recombinase XerC